MVWSGEKRGREWNADVCGENVKEKEVWKTKEKLEHTVRQDLEILRVDEKMTMIQMRWRKIITSPTFLN